jgi:hypothetical protein
MLLMVTAASEAQPQTVTPSSATARRFQLLVNGGFGSASRSFGELATFTEFLEPGSSRRDYDGGGGFVFEFGAIYSITPEIGILGSFELFGGDNDAVFEEIVPHPLLFNQDRSVSSELAGLSYRENALHVDIVYSIDRSAVTIDLFGGPSIFFTETELVTNVTTNSTYPFDEIELGSTSTSKFSESPFGFNVGAALTYRFTPVFGASVQGRFSRASVSLEGLGDDPIEFDTGGFRVSFGLRLAF